MLTYQTEDTCTGAHIYICTHVCMCECESMYACMHACMLICMYVCLRKMLPPLLIGYRTTQPSTGEVVVVVDISPKPPNPYSW